MAISEAARSDLYTGLSEVLGPERAEVLMGAIPLHDLDEVATKGDLAMTKADLQGAMSDLRTEMSDLRTEMAALRTGLKGEAGSLRTELKTDVANLRAEMIAQIGALRASTTKWMLTLLVAIIAAITSINFMS